MRKNVLIITDNQIIYDYLEHNRSKLSEIASFSFAYSGFNKNFFIKYKNNEKFFPITVKTSVEALKEQYNLIISWHCKQIFPLSLINAVRCINIHPGYNPYNRGWFPQVFSILNKKPCGATIHEIDSELDHGPIIVQKEIKVEDFDTSETVYYKILSAEFRLFEDNIVSIVDETYSPFEAKGEGNINLKQDFDKLCNLDMDKMVSMRECIDLLRALTFTNYSNAYFFDDKGNKIFVSINMKLSEK